MQPAMTRHSIKTLALWGFLMGGGLGLWGLPTDAHAVPSLDGTNVTVNFDSPGNSLNLTDVVMVGGGNELSFSDGTDIGNNVFLDKEFIDIQALDILYHAQGGGSPIPDHLTFSDLGLGDPDAAYLFSNLFPVTEKITGVTPFLTNALLLNPGTDVTFTDHSVTLVVGTLGILSSTSNVGDIRLRLTVEEITASPIPEPSSIVLLAAGFLGLSVAVARRRRGA